MIEIVIDTREQRPWAFPIEGVTTSIGMLKAGDYALKGDREFAIERKSLDDFLGTISSGWERFLRELGRMEGAGFQARIIIVEGNFEQCCFSSAANNELKYPEHNHPMITPQFICKRIAELSLMSVSVMFCGNPEYSAAMAYAILRVRYYELKNREIIGSRRSRFVSA